MGKTGTEVEGTTVPWPVNLELWASKIKMTGLQHIHTDLCKGLNEIIVREAVRT